MPSRTKIIILIITFILISVFLYYKGYFECNELDCLTTPDRGNWKLNEVYENTEDKFRAEFESELFEFIKVEKNGGIASEHSASITKVRLMQISGLFEQARSPYPGAISDEIECGSKYKPQEQELTTRFGVKVVYFKEYANDRFSLGVCEDREVGYIGYGAIFYCEEAKEWYHIEFLNGVGKDVETDKFTSYLKEIGCQRPSLNIGKLFP